MTLTPGARLIGFVLAAVAVMPLGARAQEYRWVRGEVTAITDGAVTVYVADPDLNLTFALDQSSVVFAKGAGSWVHPPEQTHPKLSNIVRIGDTVEVHYTRQGPRNHAGLIFTAETTVQQAGRSLAGRVWAVSAGSLTVEADGREYTFAVAPTTRMIGPGFGSRQSPGDKQEPKFTDLVVRNDILLVYFRMDAATMLATEIRMLSTRR
jgi:hypothetical protein